MSWARCLSLLLAAALGAGSVLTVQHFAASEASPLRAKRAQLEGPPPPAPKPDALSAAMAALANMDEAMARRLKPVETRERTSERRRKYKQSCVETLRKILRLAETGDLAYLPVPLRAEISKAIDADDYYDLCRAFNAMIAVGVVAQAYEYERERWSGNLGEPWSLLSRRAKAAIERHKQTGGTVRTLARPSVYP